MQATRARFHGGDPLALTKRIQARRRPHSLRSEIPPPREPIRPIITTWREAASILWQAAAFLVILGGIVGGLYLWALVATA